MQFKNMTNYYGSAGDGGSKKWQKINYDSRRQRYINYNCSHINWDICAKVRFKINIITDVNDISESV